METGFYELTGKKRKPSNFRIFHESNGATKETKGKKRRKKSKMDHLAKSRIKGLMSFAIVSWICIAGLSSESLNSASNGFVLDPSSASAMTYPLEVFPKITSIVDEKVEFGFSLTFPNDRVAFHSFPNVSISIENPLPIQQNNYYVRIQTENNASMEWMSFKPLDSVSISNFQALLHEYWNQSLEAESIYIDFYSEGSKSELLRYEIFKDLTTPTFAFSVLDGDVGYVNYSAELSSKTYRSSPTLKIFVEDNLIVPVTFCYTINNHFYSQDSRIIIGQFADMVITLPEWDQLPEGINEIPLYVNDSAGNPSPIQYFRFVKDTLPPNISIQSLDSWIILNGTSLSEYYNPIYDSYEFTQNPRFTLTFPDADIVWVRFYLNLTDLSFGESIPESAIDELYGDIVIDGSQINATTWSVYFPPSLWKMLSERLFSTTLSVYDAAGNEISISFNFYAKNAVVAEDSSDLFMRLVIVLLIAFGLSIFSFAIINQREKTVPLEHDLKKIDPDLLDAILQPAVPLDPYLEQKFTNHLNSLGKGDVDLGEMSSPDFQDTLKTPIQLVDIKEIRWLLSKFDMDPIEKEEFVREMLSLPQYERKAFLSRYMGILDNNCIDPATSAFIRSKYPESTSSIDSSFNNPKDSRNAPPPDRSKPESKDASKLADASELTDDSELDDLFEDEMD